MPPEYISDSINAFLENGALDAYITPVIMKKSRPGYVVSVICREKDLPVIEQTFFNYTTTIGLRKQTFTRSELDRKEKKVKFSLGEIAVKISFLEGNIINYKPEHDDVLRLSKKNNISPKHVLDIFFSENINIKLDLPD